MQIKLRRPLVVFDLETTGTDIETDRIVEIGMVRHNVNESIDVFESLVNPGIPIPKDASDVHGILDEDVAEAPTFKELAEEILGFIDGADLAGYNIVQFDLPLLNAEFRRHAQLNLNYSKANILDCLQLFRRMEPYTLEKAVKFFCGMDHPDAHGARADAEATSAVLEAQIAKYFPDTKTVDELDKDFLGECYTRCGRITWDKHGELAISFGKHSGTKFRELPSQYLHWLRRQKIFGEDHKALTVLHAALDGRALPKREVHDC
jgi:DNA polymerase-3 subunit epsilon